MKRLLFAIFLLMVVNVFGADTLYVPLLVMDSVGNGNGVVLASGDSVMVAVISPIADSVYGYRGAYNDAALKSLSIGASTKFPNVFIRVIVASPRVGNYSYTSNYYKAGGTNWTASRAGVFSLESATRVAIVSLVDSLLKNNANFDSMGGTLANSQVENGLIDSNKVTYGARLANWNIPFTTSFTVGSLGDSLNNSSYIGVMDWAHILNPTFTISLSNTTVGTVTMLTTKTGMELSAASAKAVSDSARDAISDSLHTGWVNINHVNTNAIQDSSGYLKVSRVYAYVDSSGYLKVANVKGKITGYADSSGYLTVSHVQGGVIGKIAGYVDSSGYLTVSHVQGGMIGKIAAYVDSSGYLKIANVAGKIGGYQDSSGYIKVANVVGKVGGYQDSSGYLKVSRVYAYVDSAGYLDRKSVV
jgi:hypothetical protein